MRHAKRALIALGLSAMALVRVAGASSNVNSNIQVQAYVAGSIWLQSFYPNIDFSQAVTWPTPTAATMSATSTGYWASAPAYTTTPHSGVASMQIWANNDLDFYWQNGSPLTLGSTGRTMGTQFEWWHRGTWDLISQAPPPRYYRLYTGSVPNASSPYGFGTLGMFNPNGSRHEYWQNTGGTSGSQAAVWVRAKILRSGLLDWPGVYTQPVKMHVTVSSYP